MIEVIPPIEREPRLLAAGLPPDGVRCFVESLQSSPTRASASSNPGAVSFEPDLSAAQRVCEVGRGLLQALPLRSTRTGDELRAGNTIVHLLADTTWKFFRNHAGEVYRELTNDGASPMRIEQLAIQAAGRLPGLLPTAADLAGERELFQKDKDGLEISQGLFFSQILSDPILGHHLIKSLLLPRAESLELLNAFKRERRLDLGTVQVEAKGNAGYIYFNNSAYLNAEDDSTFLPLEIAADLILLHPDLQVGVLRGGYVDHPRYAGKRVFSAGANLTQIYNGQFSYLQYLIRDMGFAHKMYRGVLSPDQIGGLVEPNDEPEQTLEKPWIAAVESFAIGGGCQLLLVVDYVVAEAGSYFSLPARKEGIIPAAANLRLARFVGERLAREAILFDRIFYVDDPESRGLVNEVVPRSEIDAAIERCVTGVVGSGLVSAGANRKAMRVRTEPLDLFRRYMATYAYQQVFCHLSEQLIRNLERHWIGRQRSVA
ncbi:enoyl-CoA hydratase/isomerase family protein [Bradyrhizobium sp. KBS0727]|uniref:enoyl-CoA hydratase/isomerase family protein n=1 Tax=unclassified Bradyrhizobium TaxID=2631580 RepID=UPI00110D7C71|nr:MULTISPECIES: enoyl-CoA hydratase/isomerase family protein [unclassified Bradyrhizobium]QDW40621.1 enoyl-CoA hydratase/isomerase family protein [Bradyrhizobium sp. KBS0725]QDW47226.1 enoyl-CoA hydratase/isomerase family protein [Bradyrhizobium sp. KBS0727]